jgi:hypothetical protein
MTDWCVGVRGPDGYIYCPDLGEVKHYLTASRTPMYCMYIMINHDHVEIIKVRKLDV